MRASQIETRRSRCQSWVCWPPVPAWSLNQKSPGISIPVKKQAPLRLVIVGIDKSLLRDYPSFMNIIRRTLEIDADTDTRLRQMADERGQDVAAVLAEAVALLDSVVDIAGPDIGEDRRRLDAFIQTRAAVPLGDVKAWVASWGSPNELPRPAPRKIG
jgi:predicted transcriptional regulator